MLPMALELSRVQVKDLEPAIDDDTGTDALEPAGLARAYSAPEILQKCTCPRCGKTAMGFRLKTGAECCKGSYKWNKESPTTVTLADFPKRACAHAHASVASFVKCEYHRSGKCNRKGCHACHCCPAPRRNTTRSPTRETRSGKKPTLDKITEKVKKALKERKGPPQDAIRSPASSQWPEASAAVDMACRRVFSFND
ncbi:unnamed protein product [Effrenium voratum]|uniref:Uncharacterized protein n=1 Tax=Effrenium voratum TaxID=2562239 RepID=A0AA36J9P8_9DINO|nr:unnamed protein product [Effrenium voratum]